MARSRKTSPRNESKNIDLVEYRIFRKAAVHAVGGESETIDCRSRPGYWLNPLLGLGLDRHIVDFIKKVPFYDYEQIGHVAMLGPKKILKWSKYRMVCNSGIFMIGSAANGDFVVVDQAGKQSQPGVGYIFHETFWNDGPTCDYCRMANSIGSFFNKVVFDERFPCDYHNAVRSGFRATLLRIGKGKEFRLRR
jgi:hypothetical protein